MSSTELYNLKWNEFHSTLSSAVGCLLEDSDFVDVTLACDGQCFGAHKVVLSACSPYFKKLLKRNPCKHPIIILKDVNASILNWLIRFIYHGGVDVPHDLLDEFLRTAQSLEIKGLAENEGVRESLPPAKRQRLSVPSPAPEVTKPSRSVYVPVEKARSLLSSSSSRKESTYISVEKAKSLVASSTNSTSSSNYIPAEKLRSLISDRTEARVEAGDSVALEDSCSGLDSERDQTESTNVKQEYSEDDIQIVESDNYAKEEPNESADGMMMETIEEDMDAGPSVMEGGLDESSSSQFYGGEYSGTEGGSLETGKPGTYCQMCQRYFTRKENLKHHILEVHTVIPRHLYETCHICEKPFKTKRRLSYHLRYTHNCNRTLIISRTEDDS